MKEDDELTAEENEFLDEVFGPKETVGEKIVNYLTESLTEFNRLHQKKN